MNRRVLSLALIHFCLIGCYDGDSKEGTRVCASHILIKHKDSKVKPDPGRTEQEAKKLAQEIAQKAKSADFAKLARQYSQCPSKKRGGDLGTFMSAKGDPAFEKALLALKAGKVSGPVETPRGFHIIKRHRLREARVAHILIMHNRSFRRPSGMTRTKEEARKKASELLVKIKKDGGKSFSDIASSQSDCGSHKREGSLGWVSKDGDMDAKFVKVALALDAGDISQVVETKFGFHIILRYE